MNTEELVDIANSLSNDDLCQLMNIVSERLFVYYGAYNNCQLTSDVHFACLNGASVQINTVSSEYDDLSKDRIFAWCLEKQPSEQTQDNQPGEDDE